MGGGNLYLEKERIWAITSFQKGRHKSESHIATRERQTFHPVMKRLDLSPS